MSEEKKIIEECSNENITPHAIIKENKQKLKETKTKTKKNKEVKEKTLVIPEIVEFKEVIKKDVIPSIPTSKMDE
jgi:putative NADH-flavin reductase